MSNPLESVVENDLKTMVEAAGGMCLKLPAILYKGIPDRMVLLPGGRVIFIELKRAKKRKGISVMQDHFLKTLCSLGFTCVIINGRPDLNNFERTHVKS